MDGRRWTDGIAGQTIRKRGMLGLRARELYRRISWVGGCALAAAKLGTRIQGLAGAFAIHEPGCGTIFSAVSPTARMRFTMMAGIADEGGFHELINGFDIRGAASEIECPALIVPDDEEGVAP